MHLRNDPKCTQILQIAPKHLLGSNGVDWVCSLQKIQMWYRGTNFCISCTCTVCFATSFMQLRNDPKYILTLWNSPKMSLGSYGVDQVHSLRKITTWLRGTNFCINSPVEYVLHQLSCTYETIPNAPKYYETHRNISIGSNGGNWLCSFHKIPRDFVSRTFVLIVPVQYILHQLSCTYETIPNAPK